MFILSTSKLNRRQISIHLRSVNLLPGLMLILVLLIMLIIVILLMLQMQLELLIQVEVEIQIDVETEFGTEVLRHRMGLIFWWERKS